MQKDVKLVMMTLMMECCQVTDKFYPVLRLKTDEEKKAAVEALQKTLKTYEDALQGKYFGGRLPFPSNQLLFLLLPQAMIAYSFCKYTPETCGVIFSITLYNSNR